MYCTVMSIKAANNNLEQERYMSNHNSPRPRPPRGGKDDPGIPLPDILL